MIRGKIIKPVYKKEIREIPYCPKCGRKLDGTRESHFVDTAYQCKCGFWTCTYSKKLKRTVFKLTKGYY